MTYLVIAFLIGAVAGGIRSMVVRRHVLPYMERRYSFADGRIRKAVAEYFLIQDPGEKGTKLLLMSLKIPLVIALVIAAFGIYLMSKGEPR